MTEAVLGVGDPATNGEDVMVVGVSDSNGGDGNGNGDPDTMSEEVIMVGFPITDCGSK